MKRWKRKAGAFLLCLALLLSNQDLLRSYAAEVSGAGTGVEAGETVDHANDVNDTDDTDNADPADDTDSTGAVDDANDAGDTNSTDPADGTDSTGGVDDANDADDTNSADPADGTDSAGGVDDANDADGTDSPDPADGTDSAGDADDADDADSTAGVNDTEDAEAGDSTNDAQGTEADSAKVMNPDEDSTVSAENLPDGVSVTAEIPAGAFDEPVTFVARILDTESDEAGEVMKEVDAVLAQKRQVTTGAYIADISFVDENGREKEPDEGKLITVTLQTQAVSINVSPEADVSSRNMAVYHVTDDNAIKLDSGKLDLDENNEFIGMSFQSDSFSPFAAVILNSVETEDNFVCKIGDKGYETLEDAITEAEDGATITLLKDVEAKKTFYKSLTFTGGYTVRMDVYGWRYNGNLIFDGADLEITTDGDSPAANNGEAGRWFTLVLSGSITAKNKANITFSFDSASGTNCAIYAGSKGVTINVENASAFCIYGKNTNGVTGQGIQLDSTANTGIFVKDNSSFLIDGTNRGYVNSPTIYVENSDFTVRNCTSNASNGGNFTAVDAEINFLDNAGHGLSADTLTIKNSEVICNRNGYYGVTVSKGITMDETSSLTANGNGKGFTGGALRLANSSTVGAFAAGARVELKDNLRNALENYGTCTFAGGVDLTVTGNTEPNNGAGIYNGAKGQLILPENAVVMCNKAGKSGGGIYSAGGTVAVPGTVKLYNNHADTAGDDIYNLGKITFGAVGTDWALDGTPDCEDAIDGWYYDGYATDENDIVINTRWNAHSGNPYTVEYTGYGVPFSGTLALKAAHTYNVNVPDVPEIPESDWDISKSKKATNLDKSYESKVTLSLPSDEEKLVSDVVFVLDKSTSPALEEQALSMLEALKRQIEDTEAEVRVGVVIFNQRANATEGLLDLATQYDDIKSFIQRDISSGTNTHAGLLAGKAMLDSDTSVEASRKYLIFVSDGITYMYNDEPTVTAWTFKADTVLNWAGPDNWCSKYGTNAAPEAWIDYLKTVSGQVTAQGTMYEYPYGGTVKQATPVANQSDYANSIDKALYLTYLTYQSAAKAGYHCYAVKANTGQGAQYTWGPSFMEFLSGDEEVSFESIQNDILYLVDAGSRVEDYMGYVSGDYDFDFVNAENAMRLKVGDNEYNAEKIGENRYGFKTLSGNSYAYTVTYERGNGKEEEHFVWAINVPVKNFEPVQLTYTVKLTNPKSAAGTYGIYDEDGSQNYEGLYTNNSATLYPKDSNGKDSESQNFAKPTVSYTVTKNQPPKEEEKNEDPGSDPEPSSDPETAVTSTLSAAQTVSTPDTPVLPQTPAAGDAAAGAATGDDSPVVFWAVFALAAIAAAAGLLIGKRRAWRRK